MSGDPDVLEDLRCDPVDHCGPRGPPSRITSQGKTKIFWKVLLTTQNFFPVAGALAKFFILSFET